MNMEAQPQPELILHEDSPYLLTSHQYFRAVEAGVFPEDVPVYLSDGKLVVKTEEPEDDPPYLLSSEEYFKMIEAGIFPEDVRLNLRGGEIVEKMAKTIAHSFLGAAFDRQLNRHLPPEYFTCPEGEFSLSDDNSVVPDFVVVRSSDPLIYARENRRPKTSDIALVIEIAVSSLAKDLGPDLRRYAQANIPASWVADLVGRRILAHTEPQVIDGLPGYAQVLTVTAGQILPLILDDREVAQIPYELLMP